MDFKGFIDGKIFDGGSSDDYPVVLGSNSFIPGFEEQLVGCKVGKEIEVKVKFPKEYNAKHLAEKDALFACKIKSINKAKPAVVNDELAKKFSSKNLSDLKNSIKDRLTNEYTSDLLKFFNAPNEYTDEGIAVSKPFKNLKSDNLIWLPSWRAKPTATSKVFSFKLAPIVTFLPSVNDWSLELNSTGIF